MQVERINTHNHNVSFNCAYSKHSCGIKRFLTFEQSEGKEVNVLTERLSKFIKSSEVKRKKNRVRTLLNLREKNIIVGKKK